MWFNLKYADISIKTFLFTAYIETLTLPPPIPHPPQKMVVEIVVQALGGGGGVNLTNFGRDLKPSVNVTLDLLKEGIICWDCSIYFIV